MERIDIEHLLQWAYGDELLKQPASVVGGGSGLLADLVLLGAAVDRGRSDRMPIAAGAPHEDALMLDWAVRQLPAVRPEWDAAQRAHLLGSLAPYLAETARRTSPPAPQARVRVRRRNDRGGLDTWRHRVMASARVDRHPPPDPPESITALVILHARLRTRPIWDLGPVRLRPVRAANGRPELLGRQIRRDLYTAGSCCPLVLDPPAIEIARARWEYQMWHHALTTLVCVLAGRLKRYVALPPAAPAAPWRC
jgi:hypothetical protein